MQMNANVAVFARCADKLLCANALVTAKATGDNVTVFFTACTSGLKCCFKQTSRLNYCKKNCNRHILHSTLAVII